MLSGRGEDIASIIADVNRWSAAASAYLGAWHWRSLIPDYSHFYFLRGSHDVALTRRSRTLSGGFGGEMVMQGYQGSI